MPRIPRIVVAGCPHHITQRGNNKQTIFFDDEDRWFYLNILRKFTTQCSTSILAYCLMPNHVHLLGIPASNHSLSKTLLKVSLTYTKFINKKYKRTGRLWECRFYSMPIEKESYLAKVCRYIERNPVRAKLVAQPADYPWSSIQLRRNSTKNDFLESSWLNNKREYLAFLDYSEEEPELELIRKTTSSGIPLGSHDFVNDIGNKFDLNFAPKPKGRPKTNKQSNS